jgi:hypothetical protein
VDLYIRSPIRILGVVLNYTYAHELAVRPSELRKCTVLRWLLKELCMTRLGPELEAYYQIGSSYFVPSEVTNQSTPEVKQKKQRIGEDR